MRISKTLEKSLNDYGTVGLDRLQYLHLKYNRVKILDEMNPKAIPRAGKIGKAIYELMAAVEAFIIEERKEYENTES